MVDRSRPDSNLNARVAPTARGWLGPSASGDCSERVDGDNEVGRSPPGPAYGPVVTVQLCDQAMAPATICTCILNLVYPAQENMSSQPRIATQDVN